MGINNMNKPSTNERPLTYAEAHERYGRLNRIKAAIGKFAVAAVHPAELFRNHQEKLRKRQEFIDKYAPKAVWTNAKDAAKGVYPKEHEAEKFDDLEREAESYRNQEKSETTVDVEPDDTDTKAESKVASEKVDEKDKDATKDQDNAVDKDNAVDQEDKKKLEDQVDKFRSALFTHNYDEAELDNDLDVYNELIEAVAESGCSIKGMLLNQKELKSLRQRAQAETARRTARTNALHSLADKSNSRHAAYAKADAIYAIYRNNHGDAADMKAEMSDEGIDQSSIDWDNYDKDAFGKSAKANLEAIIAEEIASNTASNDTPDKAVDTKPSAKPNETKPAEADAVAEKADHNSDAEPDQEKYYDQQQDHVVKEMNDWRFQQGMTLGRTVSQSDVLKNWDSALSMFNFLSKDGVQEPVELKDSGKQIVRDYLGVRGVTTEDVKLRDIDQAYWKYRNDDDGKKSAPDLSFVDYLKQHPDVVK